MNANRMPGFTAENAIFETPAHYRAAAGVCDSQRSLAYIELAVKNMACAYLYKAARTGGEVEWYVFGTAYLVACSP
jgi:hypothetical protein